MIRLYVVVEGATEERFVKEALAPSLWPEVTATPRILGTGRHRGGQVSYARVEKDVLLLLKQDKTAYCTMLIDLYGLGTGWLETHLTGSAKVRQLEDWIKSRIGEQTSELRSDVRFIPYIQPHEYEGLLFSDPEAFARGIEMPELSTRFQAIRDEFETPEDINDGKETAPSKRVLKLNPGYRKVSDGTLAAQAAGIEAMRRECPHFRAWLRQLETLGDP